MIPLLFAGVLLAAGDDSPRKSSPIAPSLPGLTKEEEEKQDKIIARFIQADTGRLRGAEASQAKKDFEKLGYEAIPALIRGLNQAAQMEHSCPILMISKKLIRLLDSSTDPKLLEYARDEIGGGIKNSPHARVLQDLRFRCLLRKNAVVRLQPITRSVGNPEKMKDSELAKAATTARGISLRLVLRELAKRDGKEALEGLTRAAGSSDSLTKRIGREMLDVHLGRLPPSSFKEKLGDDNVEVRLSAVRVAGEKIENALALIERLTDEHAGVRAEARAALKRLSKTEDYGPPERATKDQQREAQRKWQAWWDQRGK